MQMPIKLGRIHRNFDVAVDDAVNKVPTVINNNEIQISNNDVHTLSTTTTAPGFRLSSTLLLSSISLCAFM